MQVTQVWAIWNYLWSYFKYIKWKVSLEENSLISSLILLIKVFGDLKFFINVNSNILIFGDFFKTNFFLSHFLQQNEVEIKI